MEELVIKAKRSKGEDGYRVFSVRIREDLVRQLDAIAAATVGGTSHTGGVCRVSGVLCGVLIMGVIQNGLVLLGVDDNFTNIIKGVIIVVTVAFDMKKNTKKHIEYYQKLQCYQEFVGRYVHILSNVREVV